MKEKILQLKKQGLSVTDIAKKLGISRQKIYYHIFENIS